MVEDIVSSALGLSFPGAFALKVGVMLIADVLRTPASPTSGDPNVLSSTPGRLRIKVDGLKRSPKLAKRVESRIGGLDHVTSVCANTVTGTVLVTYDPDEIDESSITRAVRLSDAALRQVSSESTYKLTSLEPTAVELN